MRDTVIELEAGEGPGVNKGFVGPETLSVSLEVSAPEVEAQAKLWDQEGRAPEVLGQLIKGKNLYEWPIPKPIDQLDGWTLTWWVRLASDESTRFSVTLKVQQGGETLPKGTFTYSGPLEADEMQERSGRFHFKVGKRGASPEPA